MLSEPKKARRLVIGFVLDDTLDRPDGVQQYVLTVGEWLRSKGHDVHYLASTTIRRDIASIHDLTANAAVSFNGNRLCTPFPAPKQQIAALLGEVRFDVLHVQMPYSPLFAGRVLRAARSDTAVVGTFHVLPRSRLVAAANRLLAWWCAPTLGRFDAVMSVSPAAQAFAKKTYNLRGTVMANPINLSVFREAEPLSATSSNQVNILFLGRLVPRKGCMLLLQAALVLSRDPAVPRFTITVCGKGPLLYQLQEFVRENKLESLVNFTGFIAEDVKPRYYASADITVFPSSGGESFGIVLAEAMASGRSAVIAGDNPGYRSVLGDCPADVLFDSHDAQALAQLLKQLILDRALRRHIASWQQRHAERYDINKIGMQISQVYIAALRHRRNMR